MSDEAKTGDRRAGRCSSCGYETSVVASVVSNWRAYHSIGYLGEPFVYRLKPPGTPDTSTTWTCDVCDRSGAGGAIAGDPTHPSMPFLRAMGWLANFIQDQAARGEKP